MAKFVIGDDGAAASSIGTDASDKVGSVWVLQGASAGHTLSYVELKILCNLVYDLLTHPVSFGKPHLNGWFYLFSGWFHGGLHRGRRRALQVGGAEGPACPVLVPRATSKAGGIIMIISKCHWLNNFSYLIAKLDVICDWQKNLVGYYFRSTPCRSWGPRRRRWSGGRRSAASTTGSWLAARIRMRSGTTRKTPGKRSIMNRFS